MKPAINPGTAAVLSFFVPGLGHIYVGEIIIGLLIFISYAAVSSFVYFFLVDFSLYFAVVPFAIWLRNIFAAYRSGEFYNSYLSATEEARPLVAEPAR